MPFRNRILTIEASINSRQVHTVRHLVRITGSAIGMDPHAELLKILNAGGYEGWCWSLRGAMPGS